MHSVLLPEVTARQIFGLLTKPFWHGTSHLNDKNKKFSHARQGSNLYLGTPTFHQFSSRADGSKTMFSFDCSSCFQYKKQILSARNELIKAVSFISRSHRSFLPLFFPARPRIRHLYSLLCFAGGEDLVFRNPQCPPLGLVRQTKILFLKRPLISFQVKWFQRIEDDPLVGRSSRKPPYFVLPQDSSYQEARRGTCLVQTLTQSLQKIL